MIWTMEPGQGKSRLLREWWGLFAGFSERPCLDNGAGAEHDGHADEHEAAEHLEDLPAEERWLVVAVEEVKAASEPFARL